MDHDCLHAHTRILVNDPPQSTFTVGTQLALVTWHTTEFTTKPPRRLDVKLKQGPSHLASRPTCLFFPPRTISTP